MQKINFSFNRVRVSEFPVMVKGMLEVVAKHNPASLKIDGMYQRLLAKRPLLNLFSEPTKSEHTQVINELQKQRAQLISAILLQLKAAEKSSVPIKTAARAVILPVVRMYLEGILVNNEKVITEKVDAFLQIYSATPELTEAGNTLDMDIYIMKLKELSDSIVEKDQVRTAAKAARRLANTVELRKEIANDMNNLISAIALAEVENETLDYSLLNAELTQFLVPFNTLVRARTTRAKNSEADIKTTAADTSSQTITAAI